MCVDAWFSSSAGTEPSLLEDQKQLTVECLVAENVKTGLAQVWSSHVMSLESMEKTMFIEAAWV